MFHDVVDNVAPAPLDVHARNKLNVPDAFVLGVVVGTCWNI